MGCDRPDLRTVLISRARLQPSALAYGEGRSGRRLSYAQLCESVEDWSGSFALHGLRPGHRVGLQIADPLAFAVGYLSVIASGLTAVPLAPTAPPEETSRLSALLGVDLLVSDSAEAADTITWQAGSGGATVPAPRGRRPQTPLRSRDGEPAVILLSSGSTGEPKAVPLAGDQLLRVAAGISCHHQLWPGEVGYSPLPLFHVNAQVVGLLSAVVGGAGLVLEDRFRAGDFWAVAGSWQLTWLNLVPAMLTILGAGAAPPEEVAERIRFARSASAPLARGVQRRFEETCGVSVLETYGMTEAASQIAANPLPPAQRRPGSVGLPAGVEIRVVSGGGECAPGEVGEVCIRGANVIREYLVPGLVESRRPAIDARGWLPSGDLGWRDEAGFLYLNGRIDDVINRGGEKVFPREVEEILLSHPAVRDAAAVGVPHDVLGQATLAYVTSETGRDPDVLSAELTELCRRRLAPYKRPQAVLVVDALPKGATGKVRRLALRQAPALPASDERHPVAASA